MLESYQQRDVTLVPYSQAIEQRFATDWSTVDIPEPDFTGTRRLEDFPLAELVPYIDWSPFFATWEMPGKYPAILDDPVKGAAARDLWDSAQQLLQEMVAGKRLTAHGLYGFWRAASQGDDILVFADEQTDQPLARFCTLRQQWQRKGQDCYRALADFIAPLDSGRSDYLGAFAVTTGVGAAELSAEFEQQQDDYNSIMVKALADRLAEAFAEYLHARVRQEWGYAGDQKLNTDELIGEKYRGIRPAPGYPAQPDHTEKATLFELLNASQQTGIELTESFAMLPAASVCGLYFAHPESRYFSVTRIGEDQLDDYARRKSMTTAQARRWLSPLLAD